MSLSQVLLTGMNFVTRFKQMDFTTKTYLLAPNGSISYINDVSASIHPITQRIEERQKRKSVKSTTLLLACQQKPLPLHFLLTTWICVGRLMFMQRN